MKVYTVTQARQKLSEVLARAKKEKVLIRRRGGDLFCVSAQADTDSPLDIQGIKTQVTTADILNAIRESRER